MQFAVNAAPVCTVSGLNINLAKAKALDGRESDPFEVHSFRSAFSNNGREADTATAFSAIGLPAGVSGITGKPHAIAIALTCSHFAAWRLECCLPPSFKEKGVLGTICARPFGPCYWKGYKDFYVVEGKAEIEAGKTLLKRCKNHYTRGARAD